jgi:hypothetical protein
MIRIQLDDTTRDELQGLRRQDLPAEVRDRLEMVTLSVAGWKAAHIAEHLGSGCRTVLNGLHDFGRRGRDALFPRRRGPAPDHARREHVTGLLRQGLRTKKTLDFTLFR